VQERLNDFLSQIAATPFFLVSVLLLRTEKRGGGCRSPTAAGVADLQQVDHTSEAA
jgi:hypothetical protein